MTPFSWHELKNLTDYDIDRINGVTNSQALLRLFNHSVDEVRVTLYRDYHAWCPYCQKVWLWLEEKQIPYRIKKVTMFCYGEKEQWYKEKVSSGMLPALELDDRIITESDDILLALENEFGVLGLGMQHPEVMALRKLERLLFRKWCRWLCYSSMFRMQEDNNYQQFVEAVKQVETALAKTDSPYFLDDFSVVDVIFTPYVERMNASLFYYKGYSLREDNPYFSRWFDAMETRSTYRGTQSDFHTHAHDLPPQMGGCHENTSEKTKINQKLVDYGDYFQIPDVKYAEPENSRQEALYRVLKHKDNIIKVNPETDKEMFDRALRSALTYMMTGNSCPPPENSDIALRYLRDRISIPRDMSIYAGKRLRSALEFTASLSGDRQPKPLPVEHRRDQNPLNFQE